MHNSRRTSSVQVLGSRWSPASHEVKDYLARMRVRYRWIDVESDPEAPRALARTGAGPGDLPLIVFPDGSHLARPSDEEIARKIGLSTEAEQPFYDLVVVGGGPAGLAAAVYGGSEGLRTVIVEREAPGGQAGMSARIENFLGFPGGVAGADLAQRCVDQAAGFGVELVAARGVTSLRREEPYRVVTLDDGDEIFCHAVLLAVGVSWRVLEAPGCRGLIGRGIYYGAATAEATSCGGQDVYLIGAGNSAGQAAAALARYARTVTLVAPEANFAERMSEYLLDRLHAIENVRFRPSARVIGAEGEGRLEHITIEDLETGGTERVPTGALFVFIGAQPRTDWLEGVLARDEGGYLLCGSEARGGDGAEDGSGWTASRDPYPLESSMPGVFVAGDVRSGSTKRIGSAVGEGATAIEYIHAYLRER